MNENIIELFACCPLSDPRVNRDPVLAHLNALVDEALERLDFQEVFSLLEEQATIEHARMVAQEVAATS